MTSPPRDGRHEETPYRVRVGATWYWVEPRAPREDIEPGDTVVVYPVNGDAVVAIMQDDDGGDTLSFANLDGTPFDMKPDDIAAMHLAAVDEQR